MKHIKWFLFVLVVFLAIVIIAQNMAVLGTPVVFGINLWVIDYRTSNIPLGVLMGIAFVVGLLLMAFCGMVERFRLKKQVRLLQTDNREMDKKLDSFRNYPVSTDDINLE